MTWHERYKRAVLTYFLTYGHPLPAPGEPHQPWNDGKAGPVEDGRLREHLRTCGLDAARSTLVETTDWEVWGGSFGPDEHVEGWKVSIWCDCGALAGQGWRLEPQSLAEMVNRLAQDTP